MTEEQSNELAEVMAKAIEKAIKDIGCDPREIDWFTYKRD